MKAKNWCYSILIAVAFAVFILIVSGFCLPGTFTGTITERTDTYFTLQSTEPGVKAQAVAVKWPDTPTVEMGDTVTVWYYRKNHKVPMGLYIYKMEVKEEADSFAAGTGARLRNLVPDETRDFPVITWEEDFSLDVPEDLRLDGIDVYDENGEEVMIDFLYHDLLCMVGIRRNR